MSAATVTLTPAEYLARERAANERHEYVGGQLRHRQGANRHHTLIIVQLATVIHRAIAEKPLDGYILDMRVRIPDGPYYYPDAVVAPRPPELEDAHQDTLLNPVVVVEVLSPSTEAIDRGEKLDNYRLIPSLTDYLIVFQDRMRVEHYSRMTADEWRLVTHDGDDAIPLESLGCELRLADVYRRWLVEQQQSDRNG
ncbi:MAG: Uma2 family endonuclease [Planctomycetaceae bacterium]